jgi:hypothetical protein
MQEEGKAKQSNQEINLSHVFLPSSSSSSSSRREKSKTKGIEEGWKMVGVRETMRTRRRLSYLYCLPQ